jgi:4-hydroxy-3-methylbut-2-enyl diphosphate reductase
MRNELEWRPVKMRISVAKRSGFCFGVKRAVDIAFDVAKKKRGGVYTLGPIIHNPQVIERLRDAGVTPVDDIKDLKGRDVKAVIIRTHGVPLQTMGKLTKAGYEIIDSTCPFVKKAQHYAKLLREEGYQVIILGDSEHPEVKGLMSYAGRGAAVVRSSKDLREVKPRVGVVVQTTQQVKALKELLSAIVERTKDLKVYNTICNSTALGLKEAETMAGAVDVMVVVGGKNSANTTQLANRCRSLSVPTYHIETASAIRPKWFSGAQKVGITAGASTPDWIIKDVQDRIKNIGRKAL